MNIGICVEMTDKNNKRKIRLLKYTKKKIEIRAIPCNLKTNDRMEAGYSLFNRQKPPDNMPG